MASFIRVPMKRVPEGATQEERSRMFEEWLTRHNAANPPNWYSRMIDRLRKKA